MLQELHDLYVISNRAQPLLDPITPPSFEEFVDNVVNDPRTIPESWFLARMDGRLVGLSTLEHVKGSSDVLAAGYTAVDPDYTGRGIAMALKLQTIVLARGLGYRAIETGSSAANTRMLRINAALGFRPRPAHIVFERALA